MTRIASIDQFRGYTIAGMIAVNYLGQFACMPEWLRHHDGYMTYADTIAPVFCVVAGLGFRASFLRNRAHGGAAHALRTGLRRYLLLTLIGILVYGPFDWRGWWDALVDIGLGGLLALPVIGGSHALRLAAACGYLALFQTLFTHTAYGPWLMAHSFDGGPLGPLSWAFCLLLGSLLADALATGDPARVARTALAWGLGMCAAGYALHVPWPGLKAEWPFSQTAMTAPYPVMATGLAFLGYLPFHLLTDRWRIAIPTLTGLGSNPLLLYLLHYLLLYAFNEAVPHSSPPAIALAAFAALYALCWAAAHALRLRGLYLKV